MLSRIFRSDDCVVCVSLNLLVGAAEYDGLTVMAWHLSNLDGAGMDNIEDNTTIYLPQNSPT